MRETTSLPHSYIPVGRLWDAQAKKGNFDTNRAKVDLIIIHTMEGTTKGSTSHFSNPNTNASAHYGVSLDGSITQWIPENAVAYAAGDYQVNRRSINVEHEDGYNPLTRKNAVNEPRPPSLYKGSAELLADLSIAHKIPLDRDHVKLHREIDGRKACPGTLDIDRLIKEARAILNPTPTPVVQEEAMIAHMLKPSVFANIVKKSTNWDDFCKEAGIPPEVASSVGSGKLVHKLMVDQILDLKKRISELDSQPRFSGEKPLEFITTGTPTPLVPSPTNTLVVDAKRSNSVWNKDITEVLKGIFGAIHSRVTI